MSTENQKGNCFFVKFKPGTTLTQVGEVLARYYKRDEIDLIDFSSTERDGFVVIFSSNVPELSFHREVLNNDFVSSVDEDVSFDLFSEEFRRNWK